MPEPDSHSGGSSEGSAGHVALVVTAAPLAGHTRRTYDTLRIAGWKVTVCPTIAAVDWILDPPAHDMLSGRIRPDAVICCPATFNTLNKWAAGINDSLALGVLNDAIGLRTPVLAVPMVAERLTRHPAWPATLAFLSNANIAIMDPTNSRLASQPQAVPSGSGDDIADSFDPDLLLGWLEGRQGHFQRLS